MISIGTFDNFNIAVIGCKGLDRAGRRHDLRNADDAVAGRDRHRVWLAGGERRASRRFCLGNLSPSQGGTLARRQAGDTGRRDFFDRGAEEKQPDVMPPTIATSRRPKRPANAISSLPSTLLEIANCRPSSANCRSCRSIIGKAPTRRAASATSRRPRWRSRWAPAPTASRNSPPAGRSSWNASRIIGAPTCPTQVGQNNFDELRFEFFRDNLVALEAFKADQADWIAENSAKQWATAYDFPAVAEKRVIKEEFPINDSGRMQGFVLNLRRDQFKDARLRRAFNYAFDFEEMNKQLFYGQYKRINSYFDGTELASSGLPEGQELQILETVRDKVPAEVFTTPYSNPVGGNPEAVRANLREAHAASEGGGLRDHATSKLVDAAGKPVTVEILVQDPSAERIALFYKPSLERIGVTASIRIVDDAQYQNRLRSFDFDIIIDRLGQVAVARQRAARILGIAGRGPARLEKHHRHQESGGRRADRQGHLRQGSRRPGGRDQGARSRAALEFLRRAAIHLSAFRVTRAGTASAMPSRCRNTAVPVCRRCGGSMPTRPPRSANDLEGPSTHGAVLPPACARSRHRCAERAAAGAPPRRPMPARKRTGYRCSAT